MIFDLTWRYDRLQLQLVRLVAERNSLLAYTNPCPTTIIAKMDGKIAVIRLKIENLFRK